MSYYCVTEPLPDGWVLVRGVRLSVLARRLQMPFRLSYRPREKSEPKGGPVPVGILIKIEDEERFLAGLKKKERSAPEE